MNNPLKLKINFWSHIKVILLALVPLLFLAFLFFNALEFKKTGILFFFVFIYFVLVVPVLYLHITYYNHTAEVHYELHKSECIVRYNKGIETVYQIKEFEEFIFVAMSGKFAKTPGKLPFADYHYAKLILTNGEELIFTCLYSSNIYDVLKSYFPGIQYKEKHVLYPNISESD